MRVDLKKVQEPKNIKSKRQNVAEPCRIEKGKEIEGIRVPFICRNPTKESNHKKHNGYEIQDVVTSTIVLLYLCS